VRTQASCSTPRGRLFKGISTEPRLSSLPIMSLSNTWTVSTSWRHTSTRVSEIASLRWNAALSLCTYRCRVRHLHLEGLVPLRIEVGLDGRGLELLRAERDDGIGIALA